jgi:hypothetical protein
MKINVSIERLVLEGLPVEQHQGPLVQQALQAELAKLLAQGAPRARFSSAGAVPDLRSDTIRPSASAAPEQWGREIAQVVNGSLIK